MKVFLSSTAQDLEPYRRVADDTILRLAQQSIAMERFGPLPNTPVEECEQLARESDVVVCIVAHRYGFVPEKGRGSITRREVEAAHKSGKDVLVWIVDDSHPWTEKKEQDLLADPSVVADAAKVAEVAEGVAGLLDFKAWLRKTFTPDKFTTPDDLGRKIAVALANYVKGRTAPPVPQDRISIARLPTSGAELFGRETELKLLDDAWANPTINIVSFVAWGGVGKTALVNHWLKRRMARDNFRGAERVYGWSFFSQGSSERAASADLFIDQALRWFNDPDPTMGSPWDKGERLARYIRKSQTLLILDGVEPLQHPPGPQEGGLKDAALQALLVELAALQPGLCIITTRERIGDLVEFEQSTVIQHDLEYLSTAAGAQILRSLKVKGEDDQLEQAAKELGGHAFSLILLGSYLDEALSGDVQRRKEIDNLFEDTRYGNAAERMITAYEKWLGEGTELAILRLMGFFDRPADLGSLGVLREPPPIAGLTEPLQHFTERKWNRAVGKLRRIKLLGEASATDLNTVDAHPLIREHFKQQLRRHNEAAWREANSRLYEYLTSQTKELPDTLEEMSLLFAAVTHGCAAEKYEDALLLFHDRIQRGNPPFSIHNLGAIGTNLAALAHFFAPPWTQPIAKLEQRQRAYLLGVAGYCLRGTGRFQEALQTLQAGLDMRIAVEDWTNAAIGAGNISELYLTQGKLEDALRFAKEGVTWADRTDDVFRPMRNRAVLGRVLHQLGHLDEALNVFREAEKLIKEANPKVQFIYSVGGFWYCDLLLDKEQTVDVKIRSALDLELSRQQGDLLSIALDHLSLGRALLIDYKAGKGELMNAREHLQESVAKLRHAGMADELPRGLLARAELYRVTKDFENAERDLAEVERLAKRSSMDIYRADYHLESSRLQLDQGRKNESREHLGTAKTMISRMGYHRRDKDVAELEAQLG